MQDNPHDTAPLELHHLLPLLPAKLRQQQQQPGAGGPPYLAAADCYLHANGRPSWQLLKRLRQGGGVPAGRWKAPRRLQGQWGTVVRGGLLCEIA